MPKGPLRRAQLIAPFGVVELQNKQTPKAANHSE